MRPTIVILVLLAGVICAGGSAAPSVAPSLPVVRASEAQDGHTLTLHRGQRLQVVLHSTYWTLGRVSKTTVLRTVAKPVVRPQSGCVAGGGCGTVTAVYAGVAAGTASVTASRTSCGEAMGCTAAAGRYVLRVVVR